VVAAVRRDLQRLPVELRDCAEAASALALAAAIDQGLTVAMCSKELRAVMTALRAVAARVQAQETRRDASPPPTKESGIADLSARIAAARGSASTG